jgi:uncharacterized membrane protein
LASGVNGDGTIIVGRGDDASPPFIQAFEWQGDQSGGAMVALPGLGGGSWAFGVSADGEVSAGFSSFSAGGTFIEPTRWENGVVTSLGALSTVVLGTANLTETRAISSSGAVIVGFGLNASSSCQVVQTVSCTEAFRWEGDAVGGVMIGLGDLDSGKDGDEYVSRALAVDADGSIVGGFGTVNVGTDADPVNVKEAFVWTAEWEMRALKEVLEIDFGLDLTDWSLQEVRGISDDGLTLVGIGTRRLQSGVLVSEGWVARIPEPSTAALLGLALAAIPLTRTSCEARRV